MSLFSDRRAFGPIATPIELDQRSFLSIFADDVAVYKSMTKDHVLIVGRRGSGKTAFLYSTSFTDASNITVDVSPTRAFSEVKSSLV